MQNLNGYDSPWPAGGGKNLFKPIDSPIAKDGVTVEMTADGEFWVHGTPTIQSGYIVFSLYTFTFESALNKTVTISINEKTVGVGLVLGSGNGNLNLTLSNTATSKTGTYTQGEGEVRINVRYDVGTIDKKYKIQLEISNSATAWTPYSNICPITGWDSVTVNRTGVNVWDEDYDIGSINDNTGQNATGGNVRSKNYIPIKPSATYYFYVGNGAAVRLFFYGKDKTFLSRTDTGSATFTAPDDAYYCRFRTFNAYGADYNNDISINYPATDTEYHAYSGNTYTIQLGETVYGGTLDVVNGKMTVDRAMVDLGTLAWSFTGTLFMTLAIPGIKPPPDGNTVPNCICEAYKAVAYSRLSATDPSFTIIYEGSSNAGRLWLKDSTFTDLASFKSFISGKHLCYELATPFELTLTPEQISTLQGTNNVWSDAGLITLKYSTKGLTTYLLKP